MASTSDAELILHLYKLRQEESLRRARRFLIFDFNPKTVEELRAVSRDITSEFNVFWRQSLSFWEMAASFVLRGAVDPDLFLDSCLEGILIYGKFHHFHVESEKQSGHPFMKNTAALIERYPAARTYYEEMKARYVKAAN